MAGATRGRPSKPIEAKRRTGRSAGRDSGGRALPEPGKLVALPGAGDQAPAVPTELLTAERARTCPDAVLYEAADGPAECRVCLVEPGRALWQLLWVEGRLWLSTRSDAALLVRQVCEGRDEEAHHQAILQSHGRYVKGQRGGVVAHPAVRMLRQVRAELDRKLSLLGFTPSDRARLGVGEVKDEKSPLERMLEQRAAIVGGGRRGG